MYSATLLAIAASIAFTVGLYFMKREAESLPSLAGGWRLAAWWAFVRNPWWLLGLGLQMGGFGLYLFTLSFAPLSIVHTALNGGMALFVVLSVVGLGETVRPLEWAGVSLVIVGLIALSASLSNAPAVTADAHGMLPFSLLLAGLAGLALIVDRAPRRTTGLSLASGFMLGLGSVYAKELATTVGVHPATAQLYLFLTLLANLFGFVWMQAAFQAGRGVVVVPLFSALSNLIPIIGGIVVFGERLPEHGAGVVLRPVAFALTIGGAALLAGFSERAASPAIDPSTQADPARSR